MASKILQVVLTGDAKGALKAFGDVEKGSGASAGKAKAAWGAFGASLSSIAGPALAPMLEVTDKLSGSLDALRGKGKSVTTVMTGMGVGATGAGLALQTMASGDIAAQNQLKAAVEATGHSWEDYEGRLDRAAKGMAKFGYTDEQVNGALQTLTSAMGSPAKALKYLGETADLAAARHISLGQAADMVAKIYAGKGTRTLSLYGIANQKAGDGAKALAKAEKAVASADEAAAKARQKLTDVQTRNAASKKQGVGQAIALRNAEQNAAAAVDKAKKAHEALKIAQDNASKSAKGFVSPLDQLAKKLKGQKEAEANTFTGKLRALRAELENNISTFAQKWGPSITMAGAGLTALSAIGTTVLPVMKKLGGHVVDLAKGAAKLGPLLKSGASTIAEWAVSAGKAAVAAAKWVVQLIAEKGALIAQKAATLAAAVAEKAQAAAQWALNAAMDANPIGLVVVAIAALVAGFVLAYKHCKWFRDIVNAAFHGIAVAAKWMWESNIRPVFRAIGSFITGVLVPNLRMQWAVAQDVFHGIADVVSWAWNAVIRPSWDQIHAGIGALVAAFRWVRDTVHDAWTWIGTVIQYVWNAYIAPVWGYLKGFLDTLGSIGSSIGGVLSHLPGLGGLGHAAGTSASGGGWRWVGERGPELARLPTGTQVLNHQRSLAVTGAGSSGGGTVINVTFTGPVYDLDQAAKKMVPSIRTEMIKASKNVPGKYLPGVA